MACMSDPFSLGGFDPRLFESVPLFRELAKLLSWRGGPVNWELAGQTAAALVTGSEKYEATDVQATAEFAQAVHVAELWLDPVIILPAVDGPVQAYTRMEWVRLATSSGGLGTYVEPVAEGMASALSKGLPGELGGLQGIVGGPFGDAMRSMGAMLYGVQVGTIAGHLAGQLLGTYDLGLPTVDPRVVGTVGDAARTFARDYGFDQIEFRYWLALREAVHRRMFVGVGWLRDHLAGLIRAFASAADFDPRTLMEQLGSLGLDPRALTDPSSMQEVLSQPEAFTLEPTGGQKAALGRIQTLVAFIEAYSDTVLRAAAGEKLSTLARIEEAARRRRAEQGPGERFLAQLIGLDLKPADFRLGQRFCEAVITARGQEGLDRVWRDPDNLPTQRELADPSVWLVRMAAKELETDLGDLDESGQ
jgi:putative hydrolase